MFGGNGLLRTLVAPTLGRVPRPGWPRAGGRVIAGTSPPGVARERRTTVVVTK